MQRARVIHSIGGVRQEQGGTSRSVPALCYSLAERHIDVQLVAGRSAGGALSNDVARDCPWIHWVCESNWIRQWGVGAGFRRELTALCHHGHQCLVHDHGVWLANNHAVAVFARRHQVMRVVSPRGMLSAWAMNHHRFKKRLAWHGYQRRDLATATAFHATAQQEADELRALGFDQPVAVVPNGIRFPEHLTRSPSRNGRRTMLFLSRIHPKKGLLNLVKAWKAVSPAREWHLVIAGPDEGGHQREVEQAVHALGLQDRVSFPGEISDDDKWQHFANADVFVLPSFSENFGIVVAEALAAGTPVITTTATPWHAVASRGCGWWVDPDVGSLSRAIAEAIAASPTTLHAMGEVGAFWARDQFSWSDAAEKLAMFYRWLLNDGERPPFVVGGDLRHAGNA